MLNDMLIRLGMSGKGLKEERVSFKTKENLTIKDVFTQVSELNGLIIAPHIQSKDGIWGSKEFAGRTDILNDERLRILATPAGDIKRVEERNKTRLLHSKMDSTRVLNSYAFINVSDCHRIDDFELNTTWLKMCYPSLEGVRQIIYEPELRVAHKWELTDKKNVEFPKSFHFLPKPESATHSHILGMSVTGAGGTLDGLKIAFSPFQNSVIGKNYAGKSALLDCIRFGLDTCPQRGTDAYYKYVSRLRAFVGETGQVKIYVRNKDKVYCIARTLSTTQESGGRDGDKRSLEGKPEVYMLWEDAEFRQESQVFLHDIFSLEAYPQGEVVKLKDSLAKQMEIVDVLGKLREKIQFLTEIDVDGETTLYGKLSENSEALIECQSRIDALNEQTQGEQQLQTEIQELEALASSPLYDQLRIWTDLEVSIFNKKKELESFHEQVENAKESYVFEDVENVREVYSIEKLDLNIAKPEDYAQATQEIFNSAISQSSKHIRLSSDILLDSISHLSLLEKNRALRLQQTQEELQKKLKEQVQTQGVPKLGTEILERINEKRKRVGIIQQKIKEKDGYAEQFQKLETERASLLQEYQTEWQSIQSQRESIVEKIDEKSSKDIKAVLKRNFDRSAFRALLHEIADSVTSQSNKIANKESQLNLIADSVTPKELLDIVKRGDAGALVQSSSIKQNTANLILSMGSRELHKLETCLLHDVFEVSYRKEGDEVFTPIDQGLSGGEQALALVSVAMIPKEFPLLIDQPEDELGPALITQNLVEQIRQVKSNRQLIFVTHVPNIPVLADSEMIAYVIQDILPDGKRSRIEKLGSLEDRDIVKRLLELDGGTRAFQKRSERYSLVIETEE